MTTTRYTDDAVTVVLDDALAAFARSAVSAAERATIELIEDEARKLAEQAREDWYGSGGVTRRTGKSGDIGVVTTFDAGRSEVRVTIGSTDTRKDARGRPVAAFVHRPRPLSLIKKKVSQGEWWAWKKAGKPVDKPGTTGADDWTILEPSEKASDGKTLMPVFVRAPTTALIKRLAPELGRRIASGMGGTRG